MAQKVNAWRWTSWYPSSRNPYWYFSLSILKSLRGFRIDTILPIGSILWRANFPTFYELPRFAVSWKKSKPLDLNGGLLFRKTWNVR